MESRTRTKEKEEGKKEENFFFFFFQIEMKVIGMERDIVSNFSSNFKRMNVDEKSEHGDILGIREIKLRRRSSNSMNFKRLSEGEGINLELCLIQRQRIIRSNDFSSRTRFRTLSERFIDSFRHRLETPRNNFPRRIIESRAPISYIHLLCTTF